MSLDNSFIRSIRNRTQFKERISSTPINLFTDKARELIKHMSRYFRQFKECSDIDYKDFMVWLREVVDPDPEDLILYQALMKDFEVPLSTEAEDFLTDRLRDSDLVYKVSEVITKWANGDEIEVIDTIKQLADKSSNNRQIDDGITVVTSSTNDILSHAGTDWGFEWELPLLKKAIRPAQPGDLILVAARPDSGKTTFLGDIIRPWSNQLDKLFPGENRCILWLNNEGPGNRIKLRMRQSALQMTIGEMSQLAADGEDIDRMYEQAVGPDRVVILDIHGKTTTQVDRMLAKYNPAVVVWDMLDKVRYSHEEAGRSVRTDEQLEALYSWVREMGVIRNCVNLVSTQLSGDAENMPYPHLGMLKDSKTGKQGTADAIITFGKVETYPNTRYIGLTKNKLALSSTVGRLGEIYFDGAKGVIAMPGD